MPIMPRTTGWADHKPSQSPEGQTLIVHSHLWSTEGGRDAQVDNCSNRTGHWTEVCHKPIIFTMWSQVSQSMWSSTNHFNSLGLQGHGAQPSIFGSHCVSVELLRWCTQNNSIQQYQECHQGNVNIIWTEVCFHIETVLNWQVLYVK